ncbi:hypothetical protein GW17_00047439 [Ensete ventricosum]|nr:hypothetical protein GW17_00047439 [Ensete ventricosum]
MSSKSLSSRRKFLGEKLDSCLSGELHEIERNVEKSLRSIRAMKASPQLLLQVLIVMPWKDVVHAYVHSFSGSFNRKADSRTEGKGELFGERERIAP